jgi:putative redox protein
MAQDADVKCGVTVWEGGARFTHQAGAARYVTDANLAGAPDFQPAGPTPMESVLGALAGCSGVDMVSILQKMRLSVRALRIEAAAERTPDHPRVYTHIHLDYHVDTDPADPARVRRALRLSTDKYCSVSAMLAASVRLTYTLHYDGERYEGTFHDTATGAG